MANWNADARCGALCELETIESRGGRRGTNKNVIYEPSAEVIRVTIIRRNKTWRNALDPKRNRLFKAAFAERRDHSLCFQFF